LNELIAFAVALLISFAGSIPPAIINVQVVYNTLNQKEKEAKWMALGAMIPELPYALLAIYGVGLIKKNEALFETLEWLIIPLFLAFGLAMFFQKPKENKETKKSASFLKGLIFASLNPMLPVFWLMILIALDLNMTEYTLISPKITFALGCSAGAFLLLSTYIFLARKFRDRIISWMKYPVHKVISFVFFGIAITKVVQLTLLK
jgi:threonine/homoserine/homoserine lactone efflux protein